MKKTLLITAIGIVSVFTAFLLWPEIPGEMPARTDGGLDSPEGLAEYSSGLYRDMINGDIDIEEGFDRLLEVAGENSGSELKKNEIRFIEEVASARQYFGNDPIVRVEFAKASYADEQNASVKRIQVHDSGQKYYFRQDFKKENGQWKISGDNIDNPFRIKTKVLFRYF